MQRLIRFLTFLLFGFFALAQFGALSKSSDGFNLYLFDIYAIVFALFSLFLLFYSKHFVVPKNYLWPILFVFIAFLSLVPKFFTLSGFELVSSAFYLVRFTAYLFCGISLWNFVKLKYLDHELLMKIIMFFGLLVCISGFLQLYFLPDFERLDSSLGWDPHKNRLASTFFDPNFVGAYLSILFVFCLENFKKSKFNYLLMMFVLFISVLLTFSRSSWAMLSAIIFVYGVLKYRFLLILAVVGFVLAYLAVPRIQTRISGITDPADSAQFRVVSWKNSLKIINENLMIGVGFNSYRYAQKEYGFFDVGSSGGNSGAGTDSSLLFVTATTGIIGLFIYLFSLKDLLISKFNIAGLALLIGFLVDSMFINALFYPQILILLFCMPILIKD